MSLKKDVKLHLIGFKFANLEHVSSNWPSFKSHLDFLACNTVNVIFHI